jgi:hypothetical protein
MLSCKSTKVIVNKNDYLGKTDRVSTEDIILERHPFKTLKVKRMNIDFEVNGKSQRFRANMALARDSMIVLSIIPMMGYEAMRIICTTDSLYVINRSDRTFHKSSMESFLSKYNVHAKYHELQAILANEAFIYRSSINETGMTRKMNMVDGKILYSIKWLLEGKRYTNQTFTVEEKNHHLQRIMVEDYLEHINMSISYAEYRSYGHWDFPEKIYVNVKERKNYIKLQIQYGQVIIDESIRVSLNIPESYSRIDI